MKLEILLIVFLILFFNFPAYSQTSLISVDVSSGSFEEGETVVISGQVTTVILDTPVTIQIFNQGNLIQIAQLEVAQDGSFTHTVLATGPQWQIEGEYIVRASYGEGKIAEASFEFFKKQEIPDTSNIFEVDAGSFGTFDVPYTIRSGTVKDMIIDAETFALIIIIEASGDGSITVDLLRSTIDAKTQSGADDSWIILIDGLETGNFQDVKGDDSRLVTINFEEGDSDIEIIGTFAIPEFGSITFMVLAISIISILVFSSKKNLLKI